MNFTKTIAIKHFLNKKLKPKIDDGIEYYPPYIQVTYDGVNTKFLFDWTFHVETDPFENRFSETEFQELITPYNEHDKNVLYEVNRSIEKAIIYEESKYKSKFLLKGFGKRLAFYRECFSCQYRNDIDELFLQFAKNKNIVRGNRTYELEEKLDFFSLIEIIEILNSSYNGNLFKIIPKSLWRKIITYYFFNSFFEKNESLDRYGDWLYHGTLEKFEAYLKKGEYRRIFNSYRKEFVRIEKYSQIEEIDIYVEELKKYLQEKADVAMK
jgi:hypothetical protein